MPRLSRMLFVLLASLAIAGLIGPSFDALAQDKDKKKEATKDKKEVTKDKKEDKKEEKREEKKEPFKPDPAQLEFKYIEKEKTFWVYAVAFGADSKTVAAAYGDKSVKLWDLNTKKDTQTLKGPAKDAKGLSNYRSLIFANDHVFVGTGWWNKEKNVREGAIRVWDGKAGKAGKPLLGHVADVEFLAISKDGKLLASASEDQTVKIWDIDAGKETQTIKGHTDFVTSVSFSPDAKQVVTTSKDKTVRVWEIAGAKEIASFKVERMVEVKDAKGKVSQVKEIGREFSNAVFTNDGKKVIAGNLDGVIKIYDVDGKKEVKELKAHDGVLSLAISSDGSKFATGGWDQTIKIWATNDGKELRTIKAHMGTVTALSFSTDAQWLASGSIDGTVKVWSVK
jgi:WD40 repeat protein